MAIVYVRAYCRKRRKYFSWSEIIPKNILKLIAREGLEITEIKQS